jgi:hypothetical protein
VLREQFGDRRLRLTDDQRRRLAVRAKVLGRAALRGLTSIVTPDALLAWYRKLVAAKYNGAPQRGPGRPRTASQIAGSHRCAVGEELPRSAHPRGWEAKAFESEHPSLQAPLIKVSSCTGDGF